jgi:transposase-like protein
VRRLTAPQARRLYAAAHGKPPPKRLTHALKKLLAELEKLDDELVEQLIEIALRDERDETNDDDETEKKANERTAERRGDDDSKRGRTRRTVFISRPRVPRLCVRVRRAVHFSTERVARRRLG